MTRNNEVSVVKRGSLLPAVHAGKRESVINPSTDVYETPDAFVLVLDMPGALKDAINITMENGVMSVKAQIGPRHKEDATLLFRELRATAYYREFNVTDTIDRNNVDARYEGGVLTLKLFKKEESKPRVIEIN